MSYQKTNPTNVFEHESFASYFSAYVEAQKKIRPTFSYRTLCRDTGLKSPSLLTWFATGKRIPTNDVIEILNDYIRWTADEYAYIQCLVSYERAKNPQEKIVHLERMRKISPLKNLTKIERAALDVVMKWHVVAILEMTHLQDFQSDVDWVYMRLGGHISKEQIREAFETLQQTGLLVADENGKLQRPSKSIRAPDNLPNYAVRGWHVELMKLAQRAIHLQEPTERFYTGMTMTIDTAQIREAQSMMAQFAERLVPVVQKEGGDETYHFAIQFFRLTQKKSE